MTCKLYKLVLDHLSVEDVGFSDEVCHEGVLRLIVYVCRSSYLSDVTVIKDYDGIGKGKCLFLVVSHIDEGDSELAVHLLELDLHVLAHLQVKG